MTPDLDKAPVSSQLRASSGPLLAWVVPAGIVFAVVGIVTALAQHEAVVAGEALGIDETLTYPLTGHVLAMVLVACVAVSVAAVLVRRMIELAECHGG
jgi:hypothetical protein